MHIRPATTADIASIQHLAALVWPTAYADILSPRQMQYMLHMMYSEEVLRRQMTEEGHQFLIAEEDGKAIGFAGFGPVEGSEWKLHKLYVLPFLQQKGAGKTLITEVENLAKSQGAKSLILNVNRNNNAVGFYQHLGYQIYDQGDYPIGAGFYMNDYKMRKAIS
ncbi:MAG: GNAT family N-acetyltransferase [Bacteroidetes bacterium]|uniref:GNAT family N-acetyltransferase n=1 Tax=Phnomibacter sp. TaxID=2836217 RepID=UPI002FDDAA87|nr:GNAT family N-acetyltransferase [Bacteroidota bacterium]